MRPPTPRAVVAPLPNSALPSADWADSYEIAVRGRAWTALQAATATMECAPGWVRWLLAVRNRAGALFGLKSAELQVGDRGAAGVFPVLSASDHQAVLGFDDHHLDFRIVVDVRPPEGPGQIIRMTTLVHRKNLLGRLYLFAITPFHKIIVRTLLSAFGRQASTIS